MHHPLRVGIRQGLGHIAHDADRLRDRQLHIALEPLPERFAPHVWHDVVETGGSRLPRHHAGVVELENVRVIEAGEDRDLAPEPAGVRRRRELGPEQLERHRPLEPPVAGQIDGGRGAPAELALDRRSRAGLDGVLVGLGSRWRRSRSTSASRSGTASPGSSVRTRALYSRAARDAPIQSPVAASARTSSPAARWSSGWATASCRRMSSSAVWCP